MAAIFKIDQPTIPPGVYDQARRDLATGVVTTFTARDAATSYLWELISEPPGSAVILGTPTASTCTATLLVTGGYLLRLTIDSGLPTEDVSVRYLGIPLAVSGLPLPATNEVDFDNSVDPLAATGTAEKLISFYKWADAAIGSGSTDENVKVSATDATAGYLASKITASGGAAVTVVGAPGTPQTLDISTTPVLPMWTGAEEYWCDVTNGLDDNTDPNRGSQNYPFATVGYAADQVAAPLNQAEFLVPVIFHVASGTDIGAVNLPGYRWAYGIDSVGGTVLVGGITWTQNDDYRFGADISAFPNLLFINGGSGSIIGDVTAIYDAPTSITTPDPLAVKNLKILNCSFLGTITNAASGDMALPTGAMRLGVDSCLTLGGGGSLVPLVSGEDEGLYFPAGTIPITEMAYTRSIDLSGMGADPTADLTIFSFAGDTLETQVGLVLDGASVVTSTPSNVPGWFPAVYDGETLLYAWTYYISGVAQAPLLDFVDVSAEVVARNKVYLVAQDSALTRRIIGDIVISGCSNDLFSVIGEDPAPGGTTTSIIEQYFGIGELEGPGFRNCTFFDQCFFGSGYATYLVPDEQAIRFDAPSYASAVEEQASLFMRFEAPAVYGNPLGYRLMDEAVGVAVAASTMVGHVLPEDTTVQKVAERLDWLAGTTEPSIDLYVDPSNVSGLASDDNDGLMNTTPLLTGVMAQRRLGLRPFRCPVRVHFMSSSGAGDALPATWPIILEDDGSFMLLSDETPTVLYTLECSTSEPAGGSVNGYGGIRITGITIGGVSPAWSNDELMGNHIVFGGGTPAGYAFPIAGNGADLIEIAGLYTDFSIPATCYVITPSVVLSQQNPVTFTIEQRNSARGYAGNVAITMLDSRFVIANLTIRFPGLS